MRHGSLLSFRVAGADEDRTRHYADVLATCVIVRYALSFDGLATKVNHHKTVSEYFTPPDQLRRNGFDRLIRLAVGLEDADDLIAALNWTLHHGDTVTPPTSRPGSVSMAAAPHASASRARGPDETHSLIPHADAASPVRLGELTWPLFDRR